MEMILVMECIEYAVENDQKRVFVSLWIGQGHNTLYQNQTHDTEVTQH
jgi:hypothetical protein